MLNAVPTRAEGRVAFNARKTGALRPVHGMGSAQEVEEALAPGSVGAFEIAPVGESQGLVE